MTAEIDPETENQEIGEMEENRSEASVRESISKLSDTEFTEIVGLVEDILVGDDFQTRHTDYFSKHWIKFSESEEQQESSELEILYKERFNIFRTYSIEMAAFIESELKRSLGEQFEIQGFLLEIEWVINPTLRTRVENIESSMTQQEKPPTEGDGSPGGPQLPDFDMNGEIFDMLLTLKDYARFEEYMFDYSKMMQGITPGVDDMVKLRKISDEEADKI